MIPSLLLEKYTLSFHSSAKVGESQLLVFPLVWLRSNEGGIGHQRSFFNTRPSPSEQTTRAWIVYLLAATCLSSRLWLATWEKYHYCTQAMDGMQNHLKPLLRLRCSSLR